MRARRPHPIQQRALAAVLAVAPCGAVHLGAQTPLTVDLSARGETGVVVNPRYLAAAADTADVVSRAHLGLAVTRRGARSGLRVLGSGDWQRFRVSTGLTQFTYALSADAERRLTPRLTARATGSASTLLSRGILGAGVGIVGAPTAPIAPSPPPAGEPSGPAGPAGPTAPAAPAAPTGPGAPAGPGAPGGAGGLPVIPLALTRTYGGAVRAEFLSSERTTWSAAGEVTSVSFAGSALPGGSTARGRARVARRLTPRDALGLTVQTERNVLGAGQSNLATATVDWTAAPLARGLEVRLSLGATRLLAAASGQPLHPVGAADVSGRAGGGRWSLNAARSLSPVFGVGTLLTTEQVGATYEHAVPGGLVARVRVDGARLGDPASGGQRFTTSAVGAEVRRTITRGLWAGLGAAQYTRADGGAAAGSLIRSRDATLRAGYTTSWAPGRLF